MKETKPIRVGVIGANWSLVGHLPAWRNLEGVEVTAICTAHEETARRAAAEQGVAKAYWDYKQLLADPDIDIVDIGTKPSIRYEMVLAALAAGKHVVNANPFAPDIEGARTLLAAQKRASVVGIVEAQFQFLPQFAYIKELLNDGYLGDLYAVDCRCQFPLIRGGDNVVYPFVTRPGYTTNYTWLGDPASGANALRNLGGHCLHSLVWLFGAVETVYSEMTTNLREWCYEDGTTYAPATADTAMTSLRFRNGGIGQLNTSWAVADARGFALEIFGSKGRLRLESTSGFPDANNTRLYGAQAAGRNMTSQLEGVLDIPERFFTIEGNPIISPIGARVVVPMTRMFKEMVTAIREGGNATPDFAQACHVQEICEAAEQSSKEGRRINVPPLRS